MSTCKPTGLGNIRDFTDYAQKNSLATGDYIDYGQYCGPFYKKEWIWHVENVKDNVVGAHYLSVHTIEHWRFKK